VETAKMGPNDTSGVVWDIWCVVWVLSFIYLFIFIDNCMYMYSIF
jgi:hypothetical protein